MSSISLEQVTKTFGSDSTVVDDLPVTFAEGEFVCLLGPSGCGKTTTLRMIAGLEEVNSGRILHGTQVVSDPATGEYVPPELRNMGFMFQSYALWPHMTVADNIAFGLQMQKWPRDDQSRRIDELVELLRIDGLEKRYPSELSGGQQQRVALARMLAVNPEVLLLDEPLSNLDAALRLEMRAELKRLHQRIGCTIIFVTHDQLEAMTLATAIAVMKGGRIQQYDAPLKVYNEPANRFVAEFVGNPPMNIVEPQDGARLFDLIASSVKWPGLETTISAIGIRPEAVRIVGSGASKTDLDRSLRFEARVEMILPTGPEWIVNLRAVDRSVFALRWEAPTFAVGDLVMVQIDRSEIHMFGADGDRVVLPATTSNGANTP